jgi:hypothetical protein
MRTEVSSGVSKAIRLAFGTACFNSSRRLPAKVPSGAISTPVTLPPGRARFGTIPGATGSKLPYATIGTVDVACLAAWAACVPTVTMTSIFA